MTRVLIATLALLTGCGAYPLAAIYVPPSDQPLPANPPGVPSGTPIYGIKPSTAANIPVGVFGITTDGVTWFVEWQGDGAAHRYSGDVYCPLDCSVANLSLNGKKPGEIGYLQSVSADHFHFDDPTGGTEHQHLEFDATEQPVTFDLKIDGQAATNPATTFPAGGALSTIDHMPFSLMSTR